MSQRAHQLAFQQHLALPYAHQQQQQHAAALAAHQASAMHSTLVAPPKLPGSGSKTLLVLLACVITAGCSMTLGAVAFWSLGAMDVREKPARALREDALIAGAVAGAAAGAHAGGRASVRSVLLRRLQRLPPQERDGGVVQLLELVPEWSGMNTKLNLERALVGLAGAVAELAREAEQRGDAAVN